MCRLEQKQQTDTGNFKIFFSYEVSARQKSILSFLGVLEAQSFFKGQEASIRMEETLCHDKKFAHLLLPLGWYRL